MFTAATQRTLAGLALSALLLIPAAQAQTGTRLSAALAQPTTRSIQVVEDSESTVVPPALLLGDVKSAQIRVMNPTATSARFLVPELGVEEYIPWFSEKTFTLDLSKASNSRIKYQIQDARGFRSDDLVSGEMVVGDQTPQVISQNYEAFSSRAQQTLADLVARNQNVSFVAEQDPEPEYRTSFQASPAQTAEAPQRTTFVRGFW